MFLLICILNLCILIFNFISRFWQFLSYIKHPVRCGTCIWSSCQINSTTVHNMSVKVVFWFEAEFLKFLHNAIFIPSWATFTFKFHIFPSYTLFTLALFLYFLPSYLFSFPLLLFIHKRFQQSLISPSCPGRTLHFILKSRQRSVSHSQSHLAPLQVNSLFRSWAYGSSTVTRPQADGTMSTALPKKGPGNLLAGPVVNIPTR